MTFRRILLSVGLLVGVGAVVPRVVVAETVDKLPKPAAYVSDFAGVIDEASKQQIESLCVQVNSQAHAQVAVVTIHSLEGVEASEFANKLLEKWKVGTSSTDPHGRDRGVLLLFAIDDRKRWIEVGYGLEGVLNDAKVGDIGRSMKPQLAAGAYGPAIQGGVVQIANAIAVDGGVTITPPQTAPAYHSQQRRSGFGIGSILKVLIFLAIVVFIIGRGGGGGGLLWFLAGSMLNSGGRDGDSGFGGGGGGGDSGGGGFGGFDGGGSGGGGAGGDW